MREGLEPQDLQGAIEAMLFVTDVPVSTITMADMLQVEPAEIDKAATSLRERLASGGGGVVLTEVAGGWRLATHPRYHELLENYVLTWDTKKLSAAALEVLAIIAYAQPCTRNAVANVRGVNSDSSINSLLDKGLIREAGFEDSPGNPALYATSKAFLEKFGLRSNEDLPDLAEFAPDDETREFIRTRLSATRGYIPPTRTDESAELYTEEAQAAATEAQLDDTMRALMGQALAAVAPVVEKIDFDDLEFSE